MTAKSSGCSLTVGGIVAAVGLGALITRAIGGKQPRPPAPPAAPSAPPPPAPVGGAAAKPTLRQRRASVLITMLIAGLTAAAVICAFPVLGLTAALDPSNPALEIDGTGRITNGLDVAFKLVVNSSVLWLLAIGGVLSFVSVVASALSTTDGWKSFVTSKLVALAGAIYIAAAGILAVWPG